jgi:hypothetical protein
MKATIEVKLRPFTVPNFVIAESDTAAAKDDGVSYPISALDAATLDQMCSDFRDGVFKKAGKQQPPRCG